MENIKDYMLESPDFNLERLETLKQMFPDLFTSENKLNINELKKIIEPESITETERYEFRWFGKSIDYESFIDSVFSNAEFWINE